MKGLTVDDLMAFVSGLKEELYVEGLVQGNFTSTVRHTHTYMSRSSQIEGEQKMRDISFRFDHFALSHMLFPSIRSPKSSCSTSSSEFAHVHLIILP